MTLPTFLHKTVTSVAIAGVLLSTLAPPALWAQAPADPLAAPALDESFLAPPGEAEVPAEIPALDAPLLLDESRVRAATAVDPAIDPDMDVLTRGPVHEAYAETYNYDATPGLIVNKAPPAAIAEIPPAVRPEDPDAIWIPGYFAWDDDRMDFIWVSGCWRIPPPGSRWVPGYWNTLDDGRHQWVSGFWNGSADTELRYLPAPPTTLETGAIGTAPGPGYFWAPGYWGWQNTRYSWNPGFWSPCYDNWVWSPPCYNWTPRGCLFVRGRWDWRLPCRGQLFAPCFFPRPSLFCGTRYYSPQVCLNNNIFAMHLWVRPNYCHYYFGNYYGGNLAGRNIQPWHSYAFQRGCGDPLFSQYQARYARDGINYAQRRGDWHQHFVNNVGDRPAVNFREQLALERRDRDQPGLGGLNGGPKNFHRPNLVATTLPAVLNDQKDREVKLTKSDLRERTDLAGVRNQVERLQGERKKFEHGNFASLDGANPGQGDRGQGDRRGPHGTKVLDLPRGAPVVGLPGVGGGPAIGEGPGRAGKVPNEIKLPKDGNAVATKDRPGSEEKLPKDLKLPKNDNDVATKGRPGSEGKLSTTDTLRLSRPNGLESPRKAKAVEEKAKLPISLSLPGNGNGPGPAVPVANGPAVPKVEKKNDGPNLSRVATPDRFVPRTNLDPGIGRGGDKLDKSREPRILSTNPNGNGPPSGNTPAARLPKLEPKVEFEPKKQTAPREVSHEIKPPKIDFQPPKLDSQPSRIDPPKIDSRPPKIERSSRGASLDAPAAPRILSQPANETRMTKPGFTPRINNSNPQPVIRSSPAPKAPLSTPTIRSSPAPKAPLSTPTIRSSPAPRISSGPPPSSRSSSGPKNESRSGGGGSRKK